MTFHFEWVAEFIAALKRCATQNQKLQSA